MLLAGLAVLLSVALFLGVLALLVLVRREGLPAHRTSREYDARRREAIRLLTGSDATAPPAAWYRRERRRASPGDPLAPPFRALAAEALGVAVPEAVQVGADGAAQLASGARVVAELSTADLKERATAEESGLEIGLVLVNPEPPGPDARRVTLPVQVLFPALERAGRSDLVEGFRSLAERIR